MDIKRIVFSAICIGLATVGLADPMTNYWVGGRGNWSDVLLGAGEAHPWAHVHDPVSG